MVMMPPPPPRPHPGIMLPIEPIINIIFCAQNPESFEHMSFWYPSLEPHLAKCCLSIGDELREATE